MSVLCAEFNCMESVELQPMKYKSYPGLSWCWFGNALCCRVVQLRSVTVESYEVWLILQLYSFLLTFSTLPYVLQVFPTPAIPKENFTIREKPGLKSCSCNLALSRCLLSKSWLLDPFSPLWVVTSGIWLRGGRGGTWLGQTGRTSEVSLWALVGLLPPGSTEE